MRCAGPLWAVLLGLAVTACGLAPAPATEVGQAPIPAALSAPAVGGGATWAQGKVAFAWDGSLYILDAATTRVHRVVGQVAAEGRAQSPKWSHDGRWVAYVLAAATAQHLWVARADGTGARQVLDAPVADFAWSPTADALATAPTDTGSGLWLVPMSGSPRALAAVGTPIGSLAWSPDGKALAYTLTLPFTNPVARSDALYTVPAAGGTPTQQYIAPGAGIRLAGWWPDGRGLLFWPVPQHSGSLAADGLMLQTLPLGGHIPRPLATTLADRRWVTWSPDGTTLLLVAGAGRAVWTHKALAACTAEAALPTCHLLPQPEGTVSLDPAWSPDGSHIAFVRAAASPMPGNASLAPPATLWIGAPDGSGARPLTAAGVGVQSPQWSADGRHLLYVRGGTLWAIAAAGAPPRGVLGPFPHPDQPLGYYGRVSWTAALSWWRG